MIKKSQKLALQKILKILFTILIFLSFIACKKAFLIDPDLRGGSTSGKSDKSFLWNGETPICQTFKATQNNLFAIAIRSAFSPEFFEKNPLNLVLFDVPMENSSYSFGKAKKILKVFSSAIPFKEGSQINFIFEESKSDSRLQNSKSKDFYFSLLCPNPPLGGISLFYNDYDLYQDGQVFYSDNPSSNYDLCFAVYYNLSLNQAIWQGVQKFFEDRNFAIFYLIILILIIAGIIRFRPKSSNLKKEE